MKKFLVLFLIVFSYVSNAFSTEIYTIDSVRVRVNNEFMKDYTNLYVWQPWQKVDGTIKIDEKSNTIELCVINTIKYAINSENILILEHNDIVVTSYLLNDNLILSLYKMYNSYYFYINDNVNKVEIFYKIHNVKL